MLVSLANMIMGMKAGFLGAFEDLSPEFKWVKDLSDTIQMVLIPILIVVSAAGALYAIVLGVNMAKAESTEKREEAKKRMIGLIIGLVAMIALILFFLLLFPMILEQMLAKPLGTE